MLLIHADGADASTVFTDSSLDPHLITAVGNAQVDTAQSKFGGASALFDGTGDCLSVPDHADFDFGAGAFTIDFWMRPNSVAGGFWIVTKDAGSGYSPVGVLQFNTFLLLYATAADGSWSIINAATIGSGLATGTWYHVAVVRTAAGVWYAFLNGTQTYTTTNATALWDNTGTVRIGSDFFGGAGFNGWLDEIRISNGVAWWTAAFTPPTAAYSLWTTPTHGNPNAYRWNQHVVDNLTFLQHGKALYLPTPSEDLTASGKVHGIMNGAYCVPVIPKDNITLTSIGYRNDTANGRVDLGIYLDDNDTGTCSKIATTTPTLMAGGAGAKQISLVDPAPLEAYQKYWLVIGFTGQNGGLTVGTVLGTDGALVGLCRRALNCMPLTTVIRFDAYETRSPCLAGFP